MSRESTRDLITTAEAARILGVTPQALYLWRNERRGPPYYRIQGVFRYDRAEVVAHRDAGREEHEAGAS